MSPKISIKKKYIDALTLYQQKIKELEESTFFQFYFVQSNHLEFKLSLNKVKAGWTGRCSLNEPPEEKIKAFILPYRFFIQKGDKCSLMYLGDNVFPKLIDNFPNEVNELNNLRKKVNKYLNSSPEIKIVLGKGKKTKEFKTNLEIHETFIYGHYAHASIKDDKKEWYDFIHMHAKEGDNIIKRNIFRAIAINIILTITNILKAISNEISKILDKIINHFINQAKLMFKDQNFKKAMKNYQNALYISNKLDNKNLRAEIFKNLHEICSNTKNEKKAKVFLQKFKDVKDSIRYLSKNFWEDDYYRELFSLPEEFKSMLIKIDQISNNFSEIPIIVFSIEELHKVRRFENLIIAKNFKISKNQNNVVLWYEQIISKQKEKSYWVHQKFEFNKDEDYICRFPFLDDSGILFITNSPRLFAEWYCSWLEMKNIIQNQGLNYLFLQRYIDYLIDIELEKELNLEIFNKIKASKELEIQKYSIEGSDKILLHLNGLKNIISPLFKISIYPRLQTTIKFEIEMESLKNQSIIPYLKKKCKGQEWFSFIFTVLLYTFTTKDESIFNQIKNSEVAKLREISEIINGKPIINEFFEQFFKFCDNYIREYIINRIDPKYKHAWYNKGISSYILEQYEEAIESFEKALDIDSNDKEAWFYRGISLFKIEEYEIAINSFDKTLEIDSNDKQAWFYKGISLNTVEKYQEAVKSFDRVIEINPNDKDAWNKKAVSLYNLKHYKKSIECCDKVLNIDLSDKQAWYNKGISLINLEIYESAITCFKKLIKIDPKFVDAWNKLGYALCKLKKYEDAIKSYDNALKIDSSFIVTWNNKGISLKELKRDEEAIECYNRALELDQNFKNAWYNKAISLFNLRNFHDAIECYDKAIDIDSYFIDAWNNKGNSLAMMEKYTEAINCYDKAIKIESKYKQAWYNKGKALTKLENYDEALKCYSKVIEIEPTDKDIWFNKGSIHLAIEQYNEAIKCYDKVIEIDPNHVFAWNNRGNSFMRLEQYNEAIQSFDNALNIDPKNKGIWNNKGILYAKLEENKNALKFYNKAIEIDPNYKDAWLNKGIILGKLERYEESIDCFNKFIESDHNYIEACNNIGVSLIKLGRYFEADKCFDKVLQLNREHGGALYNKACMKSLLNNMSEAIIYLKKSCKLDDKFRKQAKTDTDFNNIRESKYFKDLIGD